MNDSGRTRLIQTARDTADRLTEKKMPVVPAADGLSLPTVSVEPGRRFQEIIGFGGAFTEAGADTLYKLSPEKRTEILTAYFHPVKGIGYSLCRTHINSCDFSLGNYSCDDVAGDTELEHFSIDRDKQLLIPFIREAQQVASASFKLYASPWSPPAWMKTNGEMNNGGKLRPEYAATWARYFCRFIDAYAGEGIPIWAVTVQNEPAAVQTWDSCIYSAEEEGAFVRDHLGPALAAAGHADVKIIIWDHNKDLIYARARETLSDPETAKYVWGIGFHWYSGDDFDNLTRTHNAFPDIKLIFTEGCQEGGVKLGSWELGERYGHDIIGDLNNWTAGWTDWNMVLNEYGGPNHVGNYCDAPVIADTQTDTVHYKNAWYYLGHFSRYIRPGAVRIGCAASVPELEAAACINSDGAITCVVMNRTDASIKFCIAAEGRSIPTEIPPHAIQTYIHG